MKLKILYNYSKNIYVFFFRCWSLIFWTTKSKISPSIYKYNKYRKIWLDSVTILTNIKPFFLLEKGVYLFHLLSRRSEPKDKISSAAFRIILQFVVGREKSNKTKSLNTATRLNSFAVDTKRHFGQMEKFCSTLTLVCSFYGWCKLFRGSYYIWIEYFIK